MHYLLKRQIARVFGEDKIDLLDKKIRDFFDIVDTAYKTADEDRKWIEHSLEIGSKELERNTALLKSAMNAIDDGILVVTNEKEIIFNNSSFIKIWSVKNALGKNAYVEFLVEIKNKVKTSDVLIRALEHGGNFNNSDSHMELYDGRLFDIKIKDHLLHNQKIGIVVIFREITEIVHRSHELEIRLKEIEKLNSFMVGRELEMINLKKKIKELENGL